MTLGCEVETNLRAKSPRDGIQMFGSNNDMVAVSRFASRVCDTYNEHRRRHNKTGVMRIKGDPRYVSGYSIAHWTIEHDASIRKDNSQQVSMEIVSPIMLYSHINLWRDNVKSMYQILGQKYHFEANVSNPPASRCVFGII
jgi:hypothetical protein